ncbi:MAG: phosphatidate cytidylyltransferase [Mediterranea sp.]|jgi:phosphatidate cytidylyltransferase|nr:phosphatidate cytidylyltransferase [Mediterranea sp.]
MNNLAQRTITGVLFVVLVVGCILYAPISFGTLFLAVSALTTYELGLLVNKRVAGANVNRPITMLGSAYLFLAVMAFCIDTAGSKVFIPYLLLLMYLFISELYLKKESPVLNWAYSMLSQLYVGLPFALLNVLAFHADVEAGEVSYNPILPLSIFIFLWLNDTGAYCFGSLLGKHRLFERISPKKSWEGSIGGGVVAIVVSFVLAYFFPFMSVPAWVGLALTVVVFGTWGDLTESLLKRQLGVKDSGNILPGHGGMLDRFDSALMAIPAAVVYLYALTWF